MHTESYLKLRTLEDYLWQTALETAGQMDISPACEESLRARIAHKMTPRAAFVGATRGFQFEWCAPKKAGALHLGVKID